MSSKYMESDFGFAQIIEKWYQKNKRDLPWRTTSNPYYIWLSEIILQQTRVAQGYDYYLKFVDKFPNVKSLASAEEQDVLKLWQGLGYYSRARNLHSAAKTIQDQHKGIFPDKYEEIIALKGIGEYTAAAIASIAFNKTHAVVDGNVYRVLSRVFGIDTPIDTGKGKKEFSELANLLIDPINPGLYNQAIMDFGALQCTPQSPECGVCPLVGKCVAYNTMRIKKYPMKQGKVKSRNRYFNYLDIHFGKYTYLQKRIAKDIWQGLYEFPVIETENAINLDQLVEMSDFKAIITEGYQVKNVFKLKHVLSHQIIQATFISLYIENQPTGKYEEIEREKLGDYPISRLTEKFLESEC